MGLSWFKLRILTVTLALIAYSGASSVAQNVGNIINLFGGIVQSATVQAALAEWQQLPPNEIDCIDQTLRRQGASVRNLIQQGILPSDQRLVPIRSGCRTRVVQGAPTGDKPLHYVWDTRPPDAFLSLRTHPTGSAGQQIMAMPNGTALQVLQRRDDGWWYVRVVSTGQTGWALNRLGNRVWIWPAEQVAAAQRSKTIQSPNQSASSQAERQKPVELTDAERARIDTETIAAQKARADEERARAEAQRVAAAKAKEDAERVAAEKAKEEAELVRQVELDHAAAENGDAAAQLRLGMRYEEGRGAPKDDVQAVIWYRKAAEQGNATAQYKLGRMYEEGRGVSMDNAQAVIWYRKAAGQGNADAKLDLLALQGPSLLDAALIIFSAYADDFLKGLLPGTWVYDTNPPKRSGNKLIASDCFPYSHNIRSDCVVSYEDATNCVVRIERTTAPDVKISGDSPGPWKFYFNNVIVDEIKIDLYIPLIAPELSLYQRSYEIKFVGIQNLVCSSEWDNSERGYPTKVRNNCAKEMSMIVPDDKMKRFKAVLDFIYGKACTGAKRGNRF